MVRPQGELDSAFYAAAHQQNYPVIFLVTASPNAEKLIEANARRCHPPLEVKEVLGIAASVAPTSDSSSRLGQDGATGRFTTDLLLSRVLNRKETDSDRAD